MTAVVPPIVVERRALEAEARAAAADLGHDVHAVFGAGNETPAVSTGACRNCGSTVNVDGKAATEGGTLIYGRAVTYQCERTRA